MSKGGWVYIMANRYRGGLYVGVTADLVRRVHQHREGTGSIHVADYGKTRCVYAERHEEIEPAIAREKLVKKWKRPWKFALIEAENPNWRDLWDERFATEPPPVQPTQTQQDQPNKSPPSPRTCLPRRRPGMRGLAFLPTTYATLPRQQGPWPGAAASGRTGPRHQIGPPRGGDADRHRPDRTPRGRRGGDWLGDRAVTELDLAA